MKSAEVLEEAAYFASIPTTQNFLENRRAIASPILLADPVTTITSG
jgi:hypothetical protein